ncbi:hypothetical protein HGRIS_014457 [Hohenbuehelia grisea]|uniref:HPP transmembrane region domain-containing protein n=1 Tax=Hohenbuehelia grisea TaxID=104357 RepID=A0ABR3JUX6_9AGAR
MPQQVQIPRLLARTGGNTLMQVHCDFADCVPMPNCSAFKKPGILEGRDSCSAPPFLLLIMPTGKLLPRLQTLCDDWVIPFIGIFGTLSVIQGVFRQIQYFTTLQIPTIIPSFGGSVATIFLDMSKPAAQPRALFIGHFIGALTGVTITTLVRAVATEVNLSQILWLAGSFGCTLTCAIMHATSTLHPPAMATTLLAAVNADIRNLSWYYLPMVVGTAMLTFSVAMLVNNVRRDKIYPAYWWKASQGTQATKPTATNNQEVKLEEAPSSVLQVPALPKRTWSSDLEHQRTLFLQRFRSDQLDSARANAV